MKFKNDKDYKIILYNDFFKEHLANMLTDFSKEVFNEEINPDVEYFVNSHYAVYLLLVDGVVKGFSSFCKNDYFGLRSPAMSNDYIFVDKDERNSYSLLVLGFQTGAVIDDNEMDLEYHFAKDSLSNNFIGRMNGELMYSTYRYSKDEVLREYKNIKRIYNAKKKKD